MNEVKRRLESIDLEELRRWAIEVLEDETKVGEGKILITELPGAKELGVFDAQVVRRIPDIDPHVVLWLKGPYRTIVSVGDTEFELPLRRHIRREEYVDGIWIDISSR